MPLVVSMCLAIAAAIVGWVLAIRSRAGRLESEQLLARQQDLSLDLICTSSFDGYFVQVNPSWKRVLGFELEELLTRPFVDFVHPDDLQATLDEVDKQAKTGQLVFNFQNRYLCADGSAAHRLAVVFTSVCTAASAMIAMVATNAAIRARRCGSGRALERASILVHRQNRPIPRARPGRWG